MDNQPRSKAARLSGGAKKVAGLYSPRKWREKGWFWTIGLFLMTYLVITVILGVVWSRSPAEFDVYENALEMVGHDKSRERVGIYTTATAVRIADTILHKPGGYLTNDATPPGVYLDNIPNWEFGALVSLRDLTQAMRNQFSRSQTQSVEDKDLQTAEPKFNYDSNSWILPSTESEYGDGLRLLRSYLERLTDNDGTDAAFYARADNLVSYLKVVEMRLGSLANRLSYAVGKSTYDDRPSNQTSFEPAATSAKNIEGINQGMASTSNGSAASTREEELALQQHQKTPWLEIDDVFFEARGYCWGLLHALKGLEYDMGDVLEKKTAVIQLKQVIRELEYTQKFVWSPMILNGTGFGPVSNHSLVMASYISRANAGIIDLRNLLREG